MRNRVVAGMCDATIVVETTSTGGSMITAKFAADEGRLVFAVPGRIDQASSQGCHQLIRDGATLLTSVEDVLSELNYLDGFRPQPIADKGAAPLGPVVPEQLSETEAAIWHCFEGGALVTVDSVVESTRLPVGTVSATLVMLELKRLIGKRADGRFEARFAQ
jgi:DNA processing protein